MIRLLKNILISLAILPLLRIALLQGNLSTYDEETGRFFFLIQQKEHEQALKLYQNHLQKTGEHRFELLQRIGLSILDDGFRQKDLESQLLALFGAAVSAHEEAYYILEESLNHSRPEIQLVALQALARFQNDRADRALLHALSASFLLVRYEAVRQLCQKKHPQAMSQAESLMYKTPRPFLFIYPPLFAMVENAASTQLLRKFFNHYSSKVRLSVILSVAHSHRDDLLPQVRQQIPHSPFAQLEAATYALGVLKDEQSLPKLEKLTASQYPTVALAAEIALYQLGKKEAVQAIEEAALKGDCFAIAALAHFPGHEKVLEQLLTHSQAQVQLNALVALLHHHSHKALELVLALLVRDRQQDIAFQAQRSPGRTLKCWKTMQAASQLLKDDLSAYQEHLEFKEFLLEKVKETSETAFIALAHQIFNAQQNDLVRYVVELLEEINTAEAIACLKQHQQQLGAPLIRHYCNLALYRLQEEGPYAEQLCQWVKSQCQTQLIRFQPFSPWELGSQPHQLTPEETSRLLIDAFEALASHQESEGIDTLIEAIATGHAKNKYALAGLLLHATQ